MPTISTDRIFERRVESYQNKIYHTLPEYSAHQVAALETVQMEKRHWSANYTPLAKGVKLAEVWNCVTGMNWQSYLVSQWAEYSSKDR